MTIEQIIQANTQAVLALTQAILNSQTQPTVVATASPVEQEVVAAPEPEVTAAYLRDAFIQMGTTCGKDAQLKVLKEFGAKKLSDVDPSQLGAVYQIITMMVEAANG